MTAEEIKNRVNQEATTRFSEVIEKVFVGLRNKHAHRAHIKGECVCDYCMFIRRGAYVPSKIILHHLKRKFYNFDWSPDSKYVSALITEDDLQFMDLQERMIEQQKLVWKFKRQKEELKKEVL